MAASRVMPVGSLTALPSSDHLEPHSYTANRLKHASAEHLHLTSRRFFIGPIPEGWLNSNRKSWYKRRLELSAYSSRAAAFDAAENQGQQHHHRTFTGLGGPSTAARMSFSFPQPQDAFDEQERSGETTEAEEEEESESDDHLTTNIEPVATMDLPQIIADNVDIDEGDAGTGRRGTDTDDTHNMSPRAVPIPPREGQQRLGHEARLSPSAGRKKPAASIGPESFRTAHEHPQGSTTPQLRPQDRGIKEEDENEETGPSLSNRASLQPSVIRESLETSSRTALLKPEEHEARRQSMIHQTPAPVENDQETAYTLGRSNTGVRFKVSEGVQQGRQRVGNKARRAGDRVMNKRLRRDTLREGTIVKMEKMLVKIDITAQQVPDDFDENASMRTDMKMLEKWKELMVVARKSKKEDSDDFRLQFYTTRVIPEIDDESTKKKPRHEIRLNPKTTRVNLYSSLDKTVCIWHPYKKGTRIIVVRPSSTAHSVEWYTFLRDALGWHRPGTLQVNVPDLDVNLKLERPFEGLEIAGLEATDEESAIARTVAAEKAVAGKIVSQCLKMLEGDPEWSEVLKKWHETAKMGLAWKRYDRLEWVYGVNEQKMYGSMAMQQSHDLELRPKHHYPTVAYGQKGKKHGEPAPIEGFLVRLTSQKGVHSRFGKAFFKRLYFYTQNQYLLFNRPAKSTPPHPPRLATITGTDIPSSHEIVEKTPLMFEIEPFKLRKDKPEVHWLGHSDHDTIQRHDRDAVEEARRNIANIEQADGCINMCQIANIRQVHWGAVENDEDLEAGDSEDVDFHDDVTDTPVADGSTHHLDDSRSFELLLTNGLVVRLQAYSQQTRNEWMRRLRQLVRYWKLRKAEEMETFKAIRRANLAHLNVDEEMEALLGQFAKKWEVQRAQASPELFHMCGISSCRSITMSGNLYLKARRRATFERCQIILAGGKMHIFQATVRKSTGAEVQHIHQEKVQEVDLRDCYVYSGLIVEDDLLYQNKTFDANHPGMAATPRVYTDDGWTSRDVDVMTCFVVWMNRRKGWFRTGGEKDTGKRARLKRVRQLGVPGRGMVFKCRSRVERDHWVLNVSCEIERVVEREEMEEGEAVRFDR